VARQIRSCFGLEQESALSVLDQRGRRIRNSYVLQRFMSVAAARYRHLPARDSSGIFLSNGGRLYLDCGKPEITTPEVTSPTDACRYSRAGEAILWDIGNALVAELEQAAHVIITRSNISYGGSNSWACHESYAHRCTLLRPSDFVPHAVSRIIYTGAGGFTNRSHAARFLISPRVAHLRRTASENTQRDRGIFHTKDEPLSRAGYRRLHVICGESTSSLLSLWLKVATTATVVAMIEAGLAPGAGLQLADPVRAMHDFAHDVTLTAAAPLVSGRQITALEMQQQLLARARQLDVSGAMSDWLPECLRLWEETLARLQQGPAAVQRSLDWAIKLDLFRQHVHRRGMAWEELEAWNRVLGRFDRDRIVDGEFCNHLANRELARSLRRARGELDPRRTVRWDDLERFLELRQELYEIDTRFGEFGPHGIFQALDAQGLLAHHVPGVEDIPRAMVEPPAAGRARLRGRVIQKMAAEHLAGACEWSYIWDYTAGKVLDLSDPFARRARWRPVEVVREGESPHGQGAARAFEQAVTLYDRGEYEMASRLMHMAAQWMRTFGSLAVIECCRFGAWIQARRGFTDGAAWLHEIYPAGPRTPGQVSDYLFVHRFQGLVPGREFREWCARGLRCLDEHPDADPRDILAIRTCQAYALLCQDRLDCAWNAYRAGLDRAGVPRIHSRFQARILGEQSEVLRRLGRHDEALSLLDEAYRQQLDGRYWGDLADLTYAQRAKVLADLGQVLPAQGCLENAIRIQRDAANVIGEVRSLLLSARLSRRHTPFRPVASDVRMRVENVVAERSALTNCPTVRQILADWDRWQSGATLPGFTDWYGGL
jgi:proteasome accessory factor A